VTPERLTIEPVTHGSVSAAELEAYGLRPQDVLDFSVNTNPLGPTPSVLRAIAAADWSRYPGDDEPLLRQTIAERAGVTAEQVVLGNGSAELVFLLAYATLGASGGRAAIVGPTFGEYARAVRVAGGVVQETFEGRPDLAFVCNPNNPTGRYLGPREVQGIVDSTGLCAIDEAYAAFVDDRWDSTSLLGLGNVVLLRSMTKDHAVPGVRLGYALAPPNVAQAMQAVQPPWSVNAGALRAGLAALQPEADAHVARARRVIQNSRALLTHGFEQLGYRVEPSAANFVLIEVGDGTAFRSALLPRGLVVRDCASFGLPRCVRVACRLPEDCQRLLAATEELVRG